VDTIIDIDLDYGKGQEQRNWEDCIEQEFTWLIRHRWDDFNFHVPFRIFQKLLHGVGTHIWPDVSGNWIPRTPRAGHVLFPDNAPFNFNEDGEYFELRDFIPANVLYRKIANEKEASSIGWKPEAVWKALAQSGKDGSGTNTSGYNPDEYQRRIRRGDVGYSATTQSGVWINTIFVREFESGKISQYAVAERTDPGDYLFKKRNRFDSFSDILTLFPFDIGDGTLHGVKGYGARTKVFFELSNRIKNAMADQVFLGAYPHFSQLQPNLDPDKLKLMIAGGMRIAPFGLQETISKYPPLDNGPLALSRELSDTMRRNNRAGMGGQQPEQVDRGTAEEYAMRQMDANRLNNGSVAAQRQQLRKFYQKMLFAACKESSGDADWAIAAREFRERMFKKGVPKEALKHISEVRAKTNAGKGSASAQMHNLMTLMQTVYPVTSEDRKVAIERDIVATLFGYSNVDRYARSVDDNELPDGDDSIIALENDALSSGGNAVAAPRQDAVKHLQGHLANAAQIVQAAQQGQIDPQQAYPAIHATGDHCGQHLKFLQSNPQKKQEFAQLYQQWQALGGIADKMKADIESAAQGSPPEEKVSDGLKIGLAKVQSDHQIKTAKAQADEARKMQAQNFKMRMESVKAAHGLQLGTAKTTAEILHSRARTSADIQLSAADTAASIARDGAKAKSSNGKNGKN
jgi:hypothetical protein